eukprot:SAG22_NODE_201_length_15391_cov_7.662176_3_plen_491_part_00
MPHLAEGRSKSGRPVSCTARYETDCSETNSLSILGQVLTNLILAASDQGTTTLLEVLEEIDQHNYNFGDYYISLFEVSQNYCPGSDTDEHLSGSGCCIRHGKHSQWQYKTWQEILDAEAVSSILGPELHMRLTTKANAGGGWIEYSWIMDGINKRKKAWVSPSTAVVELDNRQLEGYLIVEYFADEAPPTCDTCAEDENLEFGDWHCAEPEQEFCRQYDELPLPDYIIVIICVLAGVLIVYMILGRLYRQRKVALTARKTQEEAERQKKFELEIQAERAEESMKEALANQAKVLELKKLEMEYPPEWDMGLARTMSVRGVNRQVQVPIEGLFDVLPDSAEYWDFFERHFRRPPNPQNARVDPKTGQSSDTRGMHDAWITKLQRIQNSDLLTYYESQKQRIAKTPGAQDPLTETARETKGWHGTSDFSAKNIYEDRQDGFMMQFGTEGQVRKMLNVDHYPADLPRQTCAAVGRILNHPRCACTVGPWLVLR